MNEIFSMETRMVKLNILIAEPCEVVRYGLRTIFAKDSRVLNVYEVANDKDFSACIRSFQPDLIVIDQSLLIDSSLLEAKKFVVLAFRPDITALKNAYYCGALGYLSLNVSAEFLCSFLNASKKSFLIEPTLGPWIMNAVFHLPNHLSNDQLYTSDKRIRYVLSRRKNENII